VIRPVLFRPPDFVKPSVRVLTGRPFQSSERSISTSPRWPGVVGLYDLSAMLSVFRLLRAARKGRWCLGPRRCPMNLGIPKRHHPRRIWGDLRCGADSRGRGGRQEARGKVFGAFCAVPVGQNGAPLKEVHPCQRAVHEAVPNEFYRYDHQGPSDEFEE